MHGPMNVKFKRDKLYLWPLGENKYKYKYRVPSANSMSNQIIRRRANKFFKIGQSSGMQEKHKQMKANKIRGRLEGH